MLSLWLMYVVQMIYVGSVVYVRSKHNTSKQHLLEAKHTNNSRWTMELLHKSRPPVITIFQGTYEYTHVPSDQEQYRFLIQIGRRFKQRALKAE